ncbi:MAG: Rnf-Nqr domain containing protein [Planctomycetota bacterium]|jgi:Na+-transporting NADH:ubiquinone oxidoreductase subunit E
MMMLAEAASPLEGPMAIRLAVILISAALTENILLTRFLGMCPFLSISRQVRAAFGMGLAVIFVTTGTVALNWALYAYVLKPLEPYGVPAESLKLILFIVVIAAFVQLMEMLIERISIRLYFALGIFLPLITVNCAILGSSLFMVTHIDGGNFGDVRSLACGVNSLVYGFATGLGWFVAIMLMAGIRTRMKEDSIPPALRGPGITLIVAGIMAMAFVIFQGMIKL